ncbi:MAG: hypothetical protein HYV09_36145 [Deltaproteobacteria bacterium]|nr:hypothetical protein [Deltaproteobacteria bacterium]
MAFGAKLHPVSYARCHDEVSAAESMGRWALSHREEPAARWVIATINDGGNVAPLLWAARWAGYVFPRVVLGQKLCAALMATKAPGDVLGDLRPPWPAYLIDVPHGLLMVPDISGSALVSLDLLCVHHESDGIRVMLRSRSSMIILADRAESWAAALLDEDDELDVWAQQHSLPIDDQHKRALECAWRLAIGVELEMDDRSNVKPPRARTKRDAQRRSIADNTHMLVRNVDLDCRDAIGAYVSGRAQRAPSVRTLVRGHWKRQPVGPASADRKWIHVEPYWRGPQDGPLAIGVHRIRE